MQPQHWLWRRLVFHAKTHRWTRRTPVASLSALTDASLSASVPFGRQIKLSSRNASVCVNLSLWEDNRTPPLYWPSIHMSREGAHRVLQSRSMSPTPAPLTGEQSPSDAVGCRRSPPPLNPEHCGLLVPQEASGFLSDEPLVCLHWQWRLGEGPWVSSLSSPQMVPPQERAWNQQNKSPAAHPHPPFFPSLFLFIFIAAFMFFLH